MAYGMYTGTHPAWRNWGYSRGYNHPNLVWSVFCTPRLMHFECSRNLRVHVR